jgi:histone H3/H4
MSSVLTTSTVNATTVSAVNENATTTKKPKKQTKKTEQSQQPTSTTEQPATEQTDVSKSKKAPKSKSKPKEEKPQENPKTEEEDDDSKHRVYKTCGLRIPPARVRSHIDGLYINKLIDDALEPVKSKIHSYDKAKSLLESGKTKKVVDGVEVETLLTDVEKAEYRKTVDSLSSEVVYLRLSKDNLSRERTRFNNESCLLIAFVCDSMINDLVSGAKATMESSGSKRLSVESLFGRVEKNRTWVLFKDLPSFVREYKKWSEKMQTVKVEDELDSRMKEQKLAYKTLEKSFEKMSKKLAKTNPSTKNEVSEQPAQQQTQQPVQQQTQQPVQQQQTVQQVPKSEEDDNEKDGRTTFKSYVSQICKDVLGDSKSRVDKSVKVMLSNMISEFIMSISSTLKVILDLMKVKTITEDLIFKVLEMKFSESSEYKYELKYIETDVYNKEQLAFEKKKLQDNRLLIRSARKAGVAEPSLYVIDYSKISKEKQQVIRKDIVFSEPINSYREELKNKLDECSSLLKKAKTQAQNKKQVNGHVEQQQNGQSHHVEQSTHHTNGQTTHHTNGQPTKPQVVQPHFQQASKTVQPQLHQVKQVQPQVAHTQSGQYRQYNLQ